ncbi:MAG TPA: hypothetical protein VNS58_19805 [Puia sp.]|nr:hypothetical protein [Puia sp.]
MARSKNKIALILHITNEDNVAFGRLLAEDGFKLGISGPEQSVLVSAVENIGHGALGLLIESSCLSGVVPVYKKVACYFKGRIDLLVVNTPHQTDKGFFDFTDTFFAVQYALPFLTPKATVLFNGSSLTKEHLASMMSQPANKMTGVKIFWNENLIFNASKITNKN